jgi:hypothetical protein
MIPPAVIEPVSHLQTARQSNTIRHTDALTVQPPPVSPLEAQERPKAAKQRANGWVRTNHSKIAE